MDKTDIFLINHIIKNENISNFSNNSIFSKNNILSLYLTKINTIKQNIQNMIKNEELIDSLNYLNTDFLKKQ